MLIEFGAKAKARLEHFFHANHLAQDEDRLWIEPGGDVHLFEAAIGCSRKLGTVDGLLRQILAEAHDHPRSTGMRTP